MTEKELQERRFHKARDDAEYAKQELGTPQTSDPAYTLAFQDKDFLLREELRPVRFQLELLKTEMLLDEANIASTFVIYGSARIPSPEKVEALLAAAQTDQEKIIAGRLADKAKYYDEARKLAALASEQGPCEDDGQRHFVVTSGGGPSIMEAANRGAAEQGKETIGLNIVLPHEQAPNIYVTPSLSFQFHYFALRKMHFLLRARAVAVFPGGFGTFDEFFELLTLIQTGKMNRIPILLYGKDFWDRVFNFDELVLEGTISPEDIELFTRVETGEEGWQVVQDFYDLNCS